MQRVRTQTRCAQSLHWPRGRTREAWKCSGSRSAPLSPCWATAPGAARAKKTHPRYLFIAASETKSQPDSAALLGDGELSPSRDSQRGSGGLPQTRCPGGESAEP